MGSQECVISNDHRMFGVTWAAHLRIHSSSVVRAFEAGRHSTEWVSNQRAFVAKQRAWTYLEGNGET